MITNADLEALMWTVYVVEDIEKFYGCGCTGITTNSIVPYDTPASIILESKLQICPLNSLDFKTEIAYNKENMKGDAA